MLKPRRTKSAASGELKQKKALTLIKDCSFTCPYSKAPLESPCEVTSCNFNLEDNSISRAYKRCFLNYTESLRYNPLAIKKNVEYDFNKLPQEQKNQIVGLFFNMTTDEVDKKTREFYISLFSVFAEDVLLSLRKHQIDPVPYRQCVVCAGECDSLFYPKSGILPPGWGYCTYSCYQLKPPPILTLEKNLSLEFLELIRGLELEYESSHSRAKFVRQLVQWVLGDSPMS